MKKIFTFLASMAIIVSCAPTAKLVNTATYAVGKSPMKFIVTPVQADLQVSDQKISYYYEVTELVRQGGFENIVETAVKEALDVNGADVLVGLEKQIRYNADEKVEYINITGYPAKYVNFRNCEDKELLKLAESDPSRSPLLKKK
ncbi:MAG: hypothetical protein IK045_06325 [Bacteroidales bacterium]|nr:hypothetical protein [Bacteroidales bacterium]